MWLRWRKSVWSRQNKRQYKRSVAFKSNKDLPYFFRDLWTYKVVAFQFMFFFQDLQKIQPTSIKNLKQKIDQKDVSKGRPHGHGEHLFGVGTEKCQDRRVEFQRLDFSFMWRKKKTKPCGICKKKNCNRCFWRMKHCSNFWDRKKLHHFWWTHVF